MLNFDFYNKTRIIFGKDTQREVGERVKPLADKVLLHYGGGSIKKSGLYEDVVESLRNTGVRFIELGGVQPNPRLSLVREGIEVCRRENIGFILAVGGGSVIDSAKAIALGVPYDGDVWDFYETGKPAQRSLTVASILTIPAAGSESSIHSVITNEETQRKYGYGNELLYPVFSIVNPELFFTLPMQQVANGVCDMMSHIFERYFTNTKNTELIDGLCESTLKTIMKNAMLLKKNHEDYNAWAEVGFAGTVAHNGLLGLGREQDWATHGIEHELSAVYDIAHGSGLAIMTIAWMKYVYKANLDMFVQFAVHVMGVECSYRNQEAIALEGIKRLEAFFDRMDLPVRLGDLDIGSENLKSMAQNATGFASGREQALGGLEKLKWEDVLKIYELAL